MQSSRMFVLGCPNLIISVNHKPYLKILSDQQPLERVKNARLQRLKERAMMYRFRIKHTPGKSHSSADATSRYPVGPPTEEESISHVTYVTESQTGICASLSHVADPIPSEETDVENNVRYATMVSLSNSPQLMSVTWERILTAANRDRECKDLCEFISGALSVHQKGAT